jgi:hypothetical protein
MRMTTGLIRVHRAVEGDLLGMAMTITMATVRRTPRAVRKGPGKGREQRIGRGKGRQLRTGNGRGRGRGMGRETVKGKVLLYTPKGEMITLVLLFWSCRR